MAADEHLVATLTLLVEAGLETRLYFQVLRRLADEDGRRMNL
jgi:hypothetical protein